MTESESQTYGNIYQEARRSGISRKLISLMENIQFRPAVAAETEAIVTLVNSAYRGDSSRVGWTTEADLLGGQRTDAEEIDQLIAKSDSLILLCLRGDELIGTVHLERFDAQTAYLGMLVIRPGLQGQGLGDRFMQAAEGMARSRWGVARMRMQVISMRHELIAWYERRGYRRTGELIPFPSDPRFGLPKVADLEFSVLEKFFTSNP